MSVCGLLVWVGLFVRVGCKQGFKRRRRAAALRTVPKRGRGGHICIKAQCCVKNNMLSELADCQCVCLWFVWVGWCVRVACRLGWLEQHEQRRHLSTQAPVRVEAMAGEKINPPAQMACYFSRSKECKDAKMQRLHSPPKSPRGPFCSAVGSVVAA